MQTPNVIVLSLNIRPGCKFIELELWELNASLNMSDGLLLNYIFIWSR